MRKILHFASASLFVLGIAGCTPTEVSAIDQPATGLVLSAADALVGRSASVTISTNTGAVCGDDNVSVEIVQPRASGTEEFNEVATNNVITLLTAIKTDPDYEGFGLNYSAAADGLIDKYGNSSTDSILWLCYTPKDVSNINLSNSSFLIANVLDMNTLGQDDVYPVYGR